MDETADKPLDWALLAISNGDRDRAAVLFGQYAQKVRGAHRQLAEFYERPANDVKGEATALGPATLGLMPVTDSDHPVLSALDARLASAVALLRRTKLTMFFPLIIEVLYHYNRIAGNLISAIRTSGEQIKFDELEQLTDTIERMNFAARRLAEAARGSAR